MAAFILQTGVRSCSRDPHDPAGRYSVVGTEIMAFETCNADFRPERVGSPIRDREYPHGAVIHAVPAPVAQEPIDVDLYEEIGGCCEHRPFPPVRGRRSFVIKELS